jgi:hypothetical protein
MVEGTDEAMSQTQRRHINLVVLLILNLWSQVACTQRLDAQNVKRLFPSDAYEVRLLAAPHAAASGAKLIYNAHGPSEFGNTVEGEAALGASVPIYLISGSGAADAIVVGIQGAVFGRFTLTTITRDLISTDWIFAIPMTWHLGDHWLRIRYHHKSSHIGDEYIARFDAQVSDYSRDVADFTGFYQVSPELGVYAGGHWAVNVHPKRSRRFLVRTGIETGARENTGTFSPYAAADVQWEQNNSWKPTLNIQVGVWLPELAGQRSLRLAAEFLAGPSPQGQFRFENVRHLTLGFIIDP